MTFADAMKLVEDSPHVDPSPLALEALRPHSSGRYACMSDLKPIDGRCSWCAVGTIPPRRKKYCSKGCQDTAERFTYPQRPATKAWVLIHRQSCACVRCGLDYSQVLIDKIVRKDRDLRDGEWNWPKDWPKNQKVTYFNIGYGTGELWEVDHVVPIYKGGSGLGLENVQVICRKCHHRKTAEDRRAAVVKT